MRPKFILALTAITILILTATCLLRRKPVTMQPPVAGDVASRPAAHHQPSGHPPVEFAASPVTSSSPEEKPTDVDQQIQQVQLWSQADDSAGAEKILIQIETNSEKKVRMAAIKAVKQTGDREIIPALKDVAARVDDLEEKRALLDAADFLAGPTVSEQKANPQPQPDIVSTP